jgi:hypothetical protein
MTRASRTFWPAIALGALACGLAAPAKADQASAQACAQKLPPEAMTIYQATAPQVTPSTDLINLLKPTVRSLVMDGTVNQSTSRTSAKLAYPCLKDLK